MHRRTLCFAPLAIALLVPLAASAQERTPTTSPNHPAEDSQHGQDTTDGRTHAHELDTVVVTASPLRDLSRELARPVSVLSGEKLDEARAASLGETVNSIPGVQSSNFGAGVGRPVIRGMDGPRVAVLSDGLASQDVSTVSQDHSPAVEPFLADQIEVLKGPATLLYGSGAIGGAVNVVDGRVPEAPATDGVDGRTEVRYDSNTRGSIGMFRVDAGNNGFVLHADGVQRDDGDTGTPLGRQRNSFVHTRTGSVGGSLLGDWGFLGVNASRYMDQYGNPAEPGNPALGERGVHLALEQNRYELRGGLPRLWTSGGLRFSLAHTDYSHTEFENNAPGTQFIKKADEARVESTFEMGGWKTAAGLQSVDSTFRAIGEEAFIPRTHTTATGLFAVTKKTAGDFQFEAGARTDSVKSSPDGAAARSFNPLSGSLSAGWQFAPRWRVNANFDHAERAPAEEELFANGPHIATLAYERGDAALDKEAANQFELGLHYEHPRVDINGSVYANRVHGFVYLADTTDTWHWTEGDRDLPVRQWTQHDALFRGAEGEATLHLAKDGPAGQWDLRLFGDTVRATLSNAGGNLPRIAPSRVGAQLRWQRAAWRASIGMTRVASQDEVAINETATPGYTDVDGHVAWHFDGERASGELFLDGRNLTDQVQRVHTSFLKDDVVLQGRGFDVGVRLYF